MSDREPDLKCEGLELYENPQPLLEIVQDDNFVIIRTEEQARILHSSLTLLLEAMDEQY